MNRTPRKRAILHFIRLINFGVVFKGRRAQRGDEEHHHHFHNQEPKIFVNKNGNTSVGQNGKNNIRVCFGLG